jgi:hypothetical protein
MGLRKALSWPQPGELLSVSNPPDVVARRRVGS